MLLSPQAESLLCHLKVLRPHACPDPSEKGIDNRLQLFRLHQGYALPSVQCTPARSTSLAYMTDGEQLIHFAQEHEFLRAVDLGPISHNGLEYLTRHDEVQCAVCLRSAKGKRGMVPWVRERAVWRGTDRRSIRAESSNPQPCSLYAKATAPFVKTECAPP